MPEEIAAKGSSRRARKKHVSFDSSDDTFTEHPDEPMEDLDSVNNKSKKKASARSSEEMEQPDQPMEDHVSFEKAKDALADMTEDEMKQHLNLCMKLSVENKINMKNAFGLHLIEIMTKMVNQSERADIQQASLSLQASSKIYAGRVEALYQDTCRFHGHLQSIVSGGKKEKKNIKNTEDDPGMDDDDDLERGRNKPQKNKCKSFLKSEESLSIETEVNVGSSGNPHGNFVTINSAFSTSRLAPKLLCCLRLVSDLCILKCATPELCFKPITALNNELFVVSPKFEGALEKIKNLNTSHSEFQSLLASTSLNHVPQMSTPKPAAASPLFCDDDHFDAGSNESMLAPPNPGDPDLIEDAIERFDVLNITAVDFVNDISAAVTNGKFDHSLLPPSSALKKMLDKSKRSSIKPSVGKTTRKKAREPFFGGRTADDIKHLFVKGRACSVSEKILSEWNMETTSNIDLGYEFLEDLENKSEKETEDYIFKKALNQVLDLLKQNDIQYYFKYYFNKESQLWKFSRRKLSLDQSLHGTPFGNQTNLPDLNVSGSVYALKAPVLKEKRLGSLAPNDPEGLAVSFQNMSLHESIHDSPRDIRGSSPDLGASVAEDCEEPQFLVPPEPFETDIEEMMVKPPELVRPTSMKFDQRPVNLNTEKIKQLLWMIISRHLENNSASDSEPFVLFSDVYEELKLKLERDISEFISMQFAFVVLLILANQKTLLIENVEENTDLRIRKDTPEIDVSENE